MTVLGPGSSCMKNINIVGEGDMDCQQVWRQQMEHSGGDEGCAELRVLQGTDQNSSLLWCLYKAHSNQGFGLLRLTPALLTTTS